MKDSTTYFHIYSSTMAPCSLDHAVREQAWQTWRCNGCNGPKARVAAIDVRLQSPATLQKPMTILAGGFPGFVWKEFLFQLPRDILARDLLLGSVTQENGKPLDSWATFQGRHRIIIRGTKHITERVCQECGRHVYFAAGKRYLSEVPPADAEIFESDLSGLIVSPSAFEALNTSQWRKGIHVDRLVVGSPSSDSFL